MNYRKKNYRGKRNYSGRPHRRTADSYHQPLPSDQKRIPYTRHTLTKPDVEAVVDALLSGTLTQGRELERFESLLAKLTHSEFAIAFNSGTAGLHAALACLKLEPEDEVIIPTLTFCSVANMVRLVGARPVLVDCDPDTLTLSVEGARQAVTEHTKAIFTNNFGGHASDLQGLREVCDEANLLLLEDASHGLGGKYRGHYVGNQADLTCFSFHPSKAITTCEGGAVTTNNRSIAEWLRQFRHHGIQKDPRFFTQTEEQPDYYQELQYSGMNYRLSEIHAALGRSQLTRLDRHIDRRRSIAQMYFQKLGSIASIRLPFNAEWADNAYHLFPIQFLGALADYRDDIYAEFKAAGIDVQVHYVPLHRMPLFAADWKAEQFPNAEAYFGRCLSLPLYCDLSFKDLERVTDLLQKLVTKYGGEGEETSDDDDDDNAAMMMPPEPEEVHLPPPRATKPAAEPAPEVTEREAAEVPSEPEALLEGGEGLTADAPPPLEEDKPKKRVARKRTTRAKTDADTEGDGDESGDLKSKDDDAGDDGEDKPKKPVRKRATRTRTKKAEDSTEDDEEKPKKRVTRTRKTTKTKAEDGEDKPKAPRRRTTRTKKAETESDSEATSGES